MREHCKWLTRIKGGDELSCGGEAESHVVLRGPIFSAKVALCSYHKSIHDQKSANLRTASQPASRRH